MGFDKAKSVRAAEKYLASGKIPAAIQEYERIVGFDPTDFNALNTLGDLYARVENKADAIACFRRVAEHYREQGFTLKAVAMLKKLTRFGGGDDKTALSLAALYEQQGLMVEARQQYMIAADAFARSGDTRQALEVLRRIADLDPSNTQIRLRLAEGYAAGDMPELAAEAYTDAGARLSARREFEQALVAFTKALAFTPSSHAALHGLLEAHTALGTADEAAEVLEQVLKERPGDIEARAMLARAYVEAEDAPRAESATQELVSRDHSSFPLYFDVARLYLNQGASDEAARVLGWVAEPALAGKQEPALTELLQEVLARNPEQMDAHRTLVRACESARDEARLASALERLAEAAEVTGEVEEERRALTRLLQLAPAESRFAERLEEIGGPLYEDIGGRAPSDAPAGTRDVPTFESFMLNDVPAAATTPPPSETPAEFEWNSVAEQQPSSQPDASASFADLNDLTDGSSFEVSGNEATFGQTQSQEPTSEGGFQEFDFAGHAAASVASEESASASGGANVERMLKQELESVDFYVEQGYADIARDTLDMLERQYGPRPEIDARRAMLADAGSQNFTPVAAQATPEVSPNGDSWLADAEATLTAEPARIEEPPPVEVAAPKQQRPTETGAKSAPTPTKGQGIDPGLAAIFDEFREAVEDTEEDAGEDFDTHYQMGLAYREMGLLDQAVEEFQTAAALTAPGDGTPRFLQCCNLLGHCFMEKGMPRPAALWFKKGLGAPGHTEDEYQAMRYDLGTAYEQMGDNERAIEVLSEVYAIDVSYRGVAERLRELQNKEVRG
ncbi:MAG TPA: tetratricopeptide repeat protein [Pyrinomonadaceae bacterium]|jgi:tetratricopeptide (TPR) repeat protein|nr:tetratricopeptide repeat protein [Pyrinomonadaceae bacterium]